MMAMNLKSRLILLTQVNMNVTAVMIAPVKAAILIALAKLGRNNLCQE
jgi:hypothetical protein